MFVKACLVCRDAQPANMDAFAAHLANNYVPNTVIVDATASSHPPERYMEWMQVRQAALPRPPSAVPDHVLPSWNLTCSMPEQARKLDFGQGLWGGCWAPPAVLRRPSLWQAGSRHT